MCFNQVFVTPDFAVLATDRRTTRFYPDGTRSYRDEGGHMAPLANGWLSTSGGLLTGDRIKDALQGEAIVGPEDLGARLEATWPQLVADPKICSEADWMHCHAFAIGSGPRDVWGASFERDGRRRDDWPPGAHFFLYSPPAGLEDLEGTKRAVRDRLNALLYASPSPWHAVRTLGACNALVAAGGDRVSPECDVGLVLPGGRLAWLTGHGNALRKASDVELRNMLREPEAYRGVLQVQNDLDDMEFNGYLNRTTGEVTDTTGVGLRTAAEVVTGVNRATAALDSSNRLQTEVLASALVSDRAASHVADRTGLSGQHWILKTGEDLNLRAEDFSIDPMDEAIIRWDTAEYFNAGATVVVSGDNSAGGIPYGVTRWLYYDADLAEAVVTASRDSIAGFDKMYLGKITTPPSHGGSGTSGGGGENTIPGT